MLEVGRIGLLDAVPLLGDWTLLARYFFEQLSMTQKAFHPGEPHTVLETTFSIAASAESPFRPDAFEGSKIIVADWLSKVFGQPAEEYLQEHLGFSHTDDEKHWALEMAGDEQYWTFRALYPDKTGRLWVTEVSIENSEGKKKSRVGVNIKQSAILAEGEKHSDVYIEPYYPEFLEHLAADYQLMDGGMRLKTGDPIILKDEKSIAQFADRLQRQTFNQPVVVFCAPDESRRDGRSQKAIWDQAARHFNGLSRKVSGIAHVVVLIGSDAHLPFGKVLGKQGMEAGEIRVYPPKRDPDGVITLYGATQNRPSGWPGFFHFMVGRLAKASRTSHLDEKRNLGPFLTAQAQISPPEKEEIDPEVAAERIFEALHTIAYELEQIERNQNLETSPRMLATEVSAYVRKLDQLKVSGEWASVVEETRNKAESLRRQFTRAHYGITKPYEEKYEALVAWVNEHYKDKIVFTDDLERLLGDPKAAKYRDINLVYAAVELLATHYHEMKMAEVTSQPVHRKMSESLYGDNLERLRLMDTPSLVASTQERFRQDYTVTVEGEQHFLDRHVKDSSGSPNPRNSLRLYYAWDEKRRRIVVGGLGHKINTHTN